MLLPKSTRGSRLFVLLIIAVALVGVAVLLGVTKISAQGPTQLKKGSWVKITQKGSCSSDASYEGCWPKPPSSGKGRIEAMTYGINAGSWKIGARYHIRRPLQGGHGWYTSDQVETTEPPWWAR